MLNQSTFSRPIIANRMSIKPPAIPDVPELYRVPKKFIRAVAERPALRGGIQSVISRVEHRLPEGVLRPMEILKPIGAVIEYGDVKIFVAHIDQVQAQQLLLCNIGNRKISKDHVATLSEEIKLGWLLTNQGIGISRDDIIIDGQQRLKAVADGAGTITILVMYGLDPLVQQVVDHGRVRTIRDSLEMGGIKKKYNREFVSYVKLSAELFTGYSIKVTSVGAFDQWYLPFKEGVEWALTDMVKGKDTKLAPVGGALAFAHKTNPEAVSEFGAALRDHDRVGAKSPIGALHDWLARNHSGYGGGARVEIYTKVLNHLKWYIDGVKSVERKKMVPTNEVVEYFRVAHKDHPKLKELGKNWKGSSQRF